MGPVLAPWLLGEKHSRSRDNRAVGGHHGRGLVHGRSVSQRPGGWEVRGRGVGEEVCGHTCPTCLGLHKQKLTRPLSGEGAARRASQQHCVSPRSPNTVTLQHACTWLYDHSVATRPL